MLVRWLKPSYPSVYAGLSKVLKSELNSKATSCELSILPLALPG